MKLQHKLSKIMQKEPLLVSKMRFYQITMKSKEIAEFYRRIGGQILPRPGNSERGHA
jgi:hypothetical protein